jgi:hypothetical protein
LEAKIAKQRTKSMGGRTSTPLPPEITDDGGFPLMRFMTFTNTLVRFPAKPYV